MLSASSSCLLHAFLIEGIGSATLHQLVTHLSAAGLEVDSIYTASYEQCKSWGISSARSRLLVEGLQDFTLLQQEQELIKCHKVQLLTLYDEAYPEFLRQISVPPPVIYVQGSVELLNSSSIALVGSRKADSYGAWVVNNLVPPLVQAGLTIVSGGAIGIDTFAHRKTLECNGLTIAVLGSGLLKPYPASNEKLFETIVSASGSLVTCFSMNTPPMAQNFPERNRIIAGLSKGCVVIQAELKSGARITARQALDQGREVFAVPGNLNNTLSQGCHALISQGAILVNDAQTILDNIDHTVVQSEAGSAEAQHTQAVDEVLPTTIHDSVATPIQSILEACVTPQSFDALLEIWHGTSESLYSLLFELQLNDHIEQTLGGLWLAI